MSLCKRPIRAFLKTINLRDRLHDSSDLLQPSVLSPPWSKFAEKRPSGKKQGNQHLLWYYFASNVGLFIGFGPVSYYEDNVGGCWSFWLVFASSLYAILFLLAVAPEHRSAEALVADLGRRFLSLLVRVSELCHSSGCQYGSHQRRKPFRNQKRKTGILNNRFLWSSIAASELWKTQLAVSLSSLFGSLRPIHLVIISQLLTITFSKSGLSTIVNALWTGTTVLLVSPTIFDSFVVPVTRKFRGRPDRVFNPRRITIAVVVALWMVTMAAMVQRWRSQKIKAARRRQHLRIGYCVAQEILMAFTAVLLGQPAGDPFLRGCVQKLLNSAGWLS
ncbi:hypothetical protein R1sor_004286 [Riccia sorocarpa]|uniref:Uncharacterized protein n=1 Tax=Riccia sorocarpa TaxID=122646 RepID=A0ABD3HKK8_9MARC